MFVSKYGRLNESGLIDTVQPKNNIICVQCLFRTLLTSLGIQSQILSKRLRNGLDFEVYYQVDGDTARRLLGSSVLATNVNDISGVFRDTPIIDILAGITPFAAFLTDAQSNRITDKILSDESERILRMRNAQRGNFSIYRFGFMASGYDAVYRQMFADRDDHRIFDPGRIIRRRDGIAVYADEKRIDEIDFLENDELIQVNPFIMSGYWNRILFDTQIGKFQVSDDGKINSVIPRIDSASRPFSFYRSGLVRVSDDVDNGRITNFLETAVGTAMDGTNGSADVRVTRKAERAAPKRKPKITTRFIKEREDGTDPLEESVGTDIPDWMARLF